MFRRWFQSISERLRPPRPDPAAFALPPVGLSLGALLFSIPPGRWLGYLSMTGAWVGLVYLVTMGDPGEWVAGWHRWDASWYEQIWLYGWGNDPHTLVFMPGFSWLAGGLADLTGLGFGRASLVLNIFCFYVAGVLASEYLGRRATISSWGIFAAHLCSPVAFYAFVPYSDSLFYLLLWMAIATADRSPSQMDRFDRFEAALLLMIIPLVRLTGFALAIWLFFRRWFAGAVLVTLLFVLAVNQHLAKDAFFFLRAQEEFAMPHGWFLDGLLLAVEDLYDSKWMSLFSRHWLQTSALPLASTLLIVIAALWMIRRREYLWLATMLAVAFVSRNQAFWRSVPRYDLALTPFLIVPLLAWAGSTNASGEFIARWWRSFSALSLVALLLAVGLLIQLTIAHWLHLGEWAF